MSSRRGFLTTAIGALGGVSLLNSIQVNASGGRAGVNANGGAASLSANGMTSGVDANRVSAPVQEMTIRQAIDRIVADIPGAPFKTTVDTVKSGDPDQPLKGIVTTMFATDAVIEQTIQLGANFIIAHEPTFYNHADETDWLEKDSVYAFKKDLLEKHHIVVWRFHDYWHTFRPDGIRMGVLKALDWDKYYNDGAPEIVTVPAISAKDIIKKVKKQLNADKMKFIGDLNASCQRIVVMPGAAGGRRQIDILRKYAPDLLICGELNEWETSEYIRDARHQGLKMSLLVVGHALSEEPGMEALVSWLEERIKGIPVKHVASGDPFIWV